MSGGSLNYLYSHLSAEEVFSRLDDLRGAETRLRVYGMQDEADDVYAYLLELETIKRRLDVYAKRMENFLHDVEWFFSSDYSRERVKRPPAKPEVKMQRHMQRAEWDALPRAEWDALTPDEQYDWACLLARSQDELYELLELVPCSAHGPCIPHLRQWIKARLAMEEKA